MSELLKFVFLLFAGLPVSVPATAPADWRDDYDALLTRYVSPSGVKYKAWKANAADAAALVKITNTIAATAAPADPNERLAFYLNAYNAWILRTGIEKYPVKSLKSSEFYFFKKDRITVSKKRMSFDDLENGLIRKGFKEPRIHFALNCAARDCPPLHTKAFRGATLDATLDGLARAFINSPRGAKVSGNVTYASKIFDWFSEDFPGGTHAFLSKYRKGLPTKVRSQSYDWALNEVR